MYSTVKCQILPERFCLLAFRDVMAFYTFMKYTQLEARLAIDCLQLCLALAIE
jgi:hypothetical protein